MKKYTFIVLLLFFKSVTAGTVYSPGMCEFEVSFPNEPKYQKKFEPTIGSFISAELLNNNEHSFMRAECTVNEGFKAVTQSMLMGLAEQFVIDNGLRSAVYSHEGGNGWSSVRYRGYKKISKVPVTYIGQIYVGRHSLLSVAVAGPSETFPQGGIMRYLNSVKME
jgi:hypothetical protein